MLLTIWQQKSNSKSALQEDVQRQVVDVKRHGGALGDASLRDATRRARLHAPSGAGARLRADQVSEA